MHAAREQVRMQMPGAVICQRRDFDDATELGKISGECSSLSAGVDTTPLFHGLEGNSCQCPHLDKEAKRYQVRDARDFLRQIGVEPRLR